MAAFHSIAYIGAVIPMLMGMKFSAKARTGTLAETFHKDKVPRHNYDQSFFHGAITHYMFIVGLVMLAYGFCTLSFLLSADENVAYNVPADMSIFVPFPSITAMLIYMAFTKSSIVGAPHYSFPPKAGVVLAPTVLALLGWNMFKNWDSYALDDTTVYIWCALWALPMTVSQMLGLKHRKVGYSDAQVERDWGIAGSDTDKLLGNSR